MTKLNKEQVNELLQSIHPKDNEDPVDKYTELLKTVANNNQSSGIDPLMLLMLGNNNNKSMDKIYEMVAMKQAFKMLGDDDASNNKITELIKTLNDATDKKIQSIQETFNKQLELMREALPKPESEDTKILKQIASQLTKAEKKGDTDEVDRLIKLMAVIQGNKPQEKDPLDTFTKMYEMVNTGNEKYIGLKEEMLQQQNEATRNQLEQALHIIDQQKNNSDWMGELRKSTQTINQFKSFMEESGLKPVPAKTEAGKVDLKYILDTVSEVVKNIAPNLPPPKQNPSWDVDKQAQKLYNKYKDVISQDKDKPLTLEFVRQELQKNPNVENIWMSEIKKAMESEGYSEEGDIKAPDDNYDDIAKMFEDNNKEDEKKDDDKQTDENNEEGMVEEENESDTSLPEGKQIKGMSS